MLKRIRLIKILLAIFMIAIFANVPVIVTAERTEIMSSPDVTIVNSAGGYVRGAPLVKTENKFVPIKYNGSNVIKDVKINNISVTPGATIPMGTTVKVNNVGSYDGKPLVLVFKPNRNIIIGYPNGGLSIQAVSAWNEVAELSIDVWLENSNETQFKNENVQIIFPIFTLYDRPKESGLYVKTEITSNNGLDNFVIKDSTDLSSVYFEKKNSKVYAATQYGIDSTNLSFNVVFNAKEPQLQITRSWGYDNNQIGAGVTGLIRLLDKEKAPVLMGIPNKKPIVTATKNEEILQAKLNISQPLTEQADELMYRDLDVKILIPTIIKTKEAVQHMKVMDKDKNDITSQVNLTSINNGEIHVSLPKTLLSKLKNNTLTIQTDLNIDTEVPGLPKFYQEDGYFHLPVSAKNNENEQADDQVILAKAPEITGEAIAQSVFLGQTTTGLDPSKFVRNLKSKLPNDKLIILGFDTQKFDTLGEAAAYVNIKSEVTGVTAKIKVPVMVVPPDPSPNLLQNPYFTRTIGNPIDYWKVYLGQYQLGSLTDVVGLSTTLAWYDVWYTMSGSDKVWVRAPAKAAGPPLSMGFITISDLTAGTTLITGQTAKTIKGRKYSFGTDFTKIFSSVENFGEPEVKLYAYDGVKFSGADALATTQIDPAILEKKLIFEAKSDATTVSFRLEYNGTIQRSGMTFKNVKLYEFGNDVKVKYVNQNGREIAAGRKITGYFNEPYTTESVEIPGYKLIDIPKNANGKFSREDQTVTYSYQDTIKPTGTGKLTIVDSDNSEVILKATDYKDFLSDFEDNDTSAEHLKVTLETPKKDIEEMVKSVHTSSFKVRITDEAGNFTIVDVPVFVKDNNTTISAGKQFAMRSSDFKIKTIDYPEAEDKLKKLILDSIQVELWKLYPDKIGEKLNANLVSLDLSQVPPAATFPKAGSYRIGLSYSENDVTINKITQMEVEDVYSSVVVNFLDEVGNNLHTSITIDGAVGSNINLTENKTVVDVIHEIMSKNYQLKQRPVNETSIPMKESSEIVQYKFAGFLSILSSPAILDFDTQTISVDVTKFTKPQIVGSSLVISDTRVDKVAWNLKAKVDQPLTNLADARAKIPGAIKYDYNDNQLTLTDENIVILSHSNMNLTNYDVTKERWLKGEGFSLNLPPGAVKALGKYQAKITITLENAK